MKKIAVIAVGMVLALGFSGCDKKEEAKEVQVLAQPVQEATEAQAQEAEEVATEEAATVETEVETEEEAVLEEVVIEQEEQTQAN